MRYVAAAIITAAAAFGGWVWLDRSAAVGEDDSLTWTAERTDMRVTVTERGTLQSQKVVNGICEVEGYENKIIFIVEEGSIVEKDDVVVRFDSSAIDKEIDEETIEIAQAQGEVDTTLQEIEVARNTGESEIATAQLELTLAKLDLEKYRDGDYEVEVSDLKGKIALAEVELEKAQEALQNTKELVRKGFREPEQIRTAEQSVESARFNLERDRRQLEVLQKYDFKRRLTEYEAKAEEAERNLTRARANASAKLKKAESEHARALNKLKLQQEDLAEEQENKAKCEIRAEQPGVVAYANEDWWSESRRIREGGTVYERQVVFFIPDMNQMQVEVKVHESEVKRIAAGQKAVIRVDAFANQVFTGTVKSVAQLSQSDRFMSSGVKEYTTIVTIDDNNGTALRPGMTAEVEILVSSLSDVIAVPVQAVTEYRRKHFVYRSTPDGFVRQDVSIGATNDKLIVIRDGLDEGDIVALDARSRAADEFRDDDSTDDSEAIRRLEELAAETALAAPADTAPAEGDLGEVNSADMEGADEFPTETGAEDDADDVTGAEEAEAGTSPETPAENEIPAATETVPADSGSATSQDSQVPQ